MVLSAEPYDNARPEKFNRTDSIVLVLLALMTTIFIVGHLKRPISPMEDASMLLRYSQHLAEGHGIVWNVGEHPVEGATDFLFMVAIGAISWLTKVGVARVSMGLLSISHVAGVLVLYAGLRRLYRAPILLAIGFAVSLAVGLGYHFINTEFGAPFYGLFALLTWYVGTACVLYGVNWRRAISFAAFAFITGLIRPDGVILAGFILCSTLYAVRGRRIPLVVSFGAIFSILGGAYFAWRLHYFGYPFPNPFYIKHAHGLNTGGLKVSGRLVVEMLLPFIPLAGLGFRNRNGFRQLTTWLITVVPFTAVWMLISLDNNHFARFQYVMVPLSMMALGGLAAVWWQEVERASVATALKVPLGWVTVVLFGCACFYNMHLYRAPFSNVGAQELAARLRPYAAKNYTMVVTEAGDLPFYSQWRTVDALGLNDEFVAHHGGVLTEAYLDTYHPEVILYRQAGLYGALAGYKVPATSIDPANKLVLNDIVLHDYAIKHGYVLAAMWGAVYCDLHVYWVKPDFADSAAIFSAIRDHPYYMQVTGQLSYDFRDAPVPPVPCEVKRSLSE